MPTSSSGHLLHFCETVVIAALGGGAVGLMGFPAGWLWGAFLAVMLAALAGRPVTMPKPVAAVTFVFLGTMLGGAVTPESLGAMSKWPLSLTLLTLAMGAMTAAVALYLRYVHGWDALSAVFAAAPGALSQSLALAASTGADVRSVAMVQAVRILVYTAGLPAVIGTAALEKVSPPPAQLAGYSWGELAILLTTCAIVSALALRWRVPGGLIVGSMVASSLLHGSGIVHVNPPAAVANLFFLLLGAMIGGRFVGVTMRAMRQIAACAIGALAVGTVVAFGFAYGAAQLLSIRTSDMFLAYVPGGLEAMTILAFALNLDPVFVGAHHLARYVLLTALLPIVAAWLQTGKDTTKS